MVSVELIYDGDCPNVDKARTQLEQALADAGVKARRQEWERSDANSPGYVRSYGSPTILVNGKDVAGFLPEGTIRGCRIYSDADGKFSGVPSVQAIASALLEAKERALASQRSGPAATSRWLSSLGVFPAIGAVLLPVIGCPACWPAYAALLGVVGIGFVNYTPYLLPLTLVCLAVALISLGFRARRHHALGPFALGSVAAFVVLTGKFVLAWKSATFAGLILLVAAYIWNWWPRKTSSRAACPDCVPAAAPTTEREHRQPEKGD